MYLKTHYSDKNLILVFTLIIQQVKEESDESDEDDEDEIDPENSVFGVTTVINLTSRKVRFYCLYLMIAWNFLNLLKWKVYIYKML